MLKYFIEYMNLDQVKSICVAINSMKRKLQSGDFINPMQEFEDVEPMFQEIKEIAVKTKNERLANAQYVFKEYFLLFCELRNYFNKLKIKDYKASWDKLQDCFDIIKFVGKFTNEENRFELPSLYDLLLEYEALYPYKLFCSSEFVIEKATCSICGKSVLGLDCPHIKGELYWGEPCIHKIEKIKYFQGVALVAHPENKRCIMQVVDDDITDDEKFKKLDDFIGLNLPFLQMFSINSKIERKMDVKYKNVGRNDICPCGSGKKFKRCCISKLYYQHIKYSVTPSKKIELFYF